MFIPTNPDPVRRWNGEVAAEEWEFLLAIFANALIYCNVWNVRRRAAEEVEWVLAATRGEQIDWRNNSDIFMCDGGILLLHPLR